MQQRVLEPLKAGDEVRIIAPANSLAVVSEENQRIAMQKLSELGFKVTFGKHVLECDDFGSSSVLSRLKDLHQAFADVNVKGILTVLGGYNSNQILSGIDYDLISRNPKILCGFSDITALQNALWARSNIISYSGPHYSSFAMKQGFDYTLEHFQKALMEKGSYQIKPSREWSSDSTWYLDQTNRSFEKNSGPKVLQEGDVEGTIIGGNLETLVLLKGTPFMPSLQDAILFLEDTGSGARDVEFDRNLQSLIDLPDFAKVRAIGIGRFEKTAKINSDKLEAILLSKPRLQNLPIVYDLDFGHTTPFFTFPIGGRVKIKLQCQGGIFLEILR